MIRGKVSTKIEDVRFYDARDAIWLLNYIEDIGYISVFDYELLCKLSPWELDEEEGQKIAYVSADVDNATIGTERVHNLNLYMIMLNKELEEL